MEHDEVVDEVCMVEQEGRADGNTTSSSEGDGVASSSSSSNSSSSTLREVEDAPVSGMCTTMLLPYACPLSLIVVK